MIQNTKIAILLVDDRPENLTALEALLEDLGLDMYCAQSGNEALSLVLKHDFALVLMDVNMPEMDGFETAELIRANRKTSNLPIIFVTAALREAGGLFQGYEAGGVDFLLKPIDPVILRSKVQVFCDLYHQRRQIQLHQQQLEFLVEERTAKLRVANERLQQELFERTRIEEALRTSKDFIRNILDSVDEGFIVVGPEYRVVSANRAFCEMVGLSEEEVTGRLCYELSHGEKRPCSESGHDCPVQRTIATGETHTVSHVHEGHDGEKSYVELKSYPIINSANRVVSVIETINDVTEKRRLEDQLHQAQKLESVGQLAGGVAHDFNNMLAIILGRTQLALKKLAPEDPLYGNLQEIRKSAEHSADLTRQLLAFARKQVITPKVIDLNVAVEGTLKMLQRLIGEAVELDWVPGASSLPVNMDPSQLDQVLANLCVNARDAVDNAGKITIRTDQAVLDAKYNLETVDTFPGNYVILAVSDNGRGMDKKLLERIFEPFFTTKEIGRGTGLGLATVYGIVKQNGGVIKVYSEPGMGTSFKIYLPRHDQSPVSHPAECEEMPPERGDETILLVEDDPGILGITQQMLEDCGYRVLAADSPEMALSMAPKDAAGIDLLLTDVVMPGMNGRELWDHLVTQAPQIKCLYMSGYPTDVIVQHGVLEEGVHFIQKPFSLDGLATKVRMALGANPMESGTPG